MPILGLGNNLTKGGVQGFSNRYSLALDGTDDFGYINMTQYDVYNSDSPQAISFSVWVKKNEWEGVADAGKLFGDSVVQMSFDAEEQLYVGVSELRLLTLYGGALHEIYLKSTSYVAGTTGWIHL